MLGIEYSPCYHCDKTKCSFCELTRYKDLQQKKEGGEVKENEKIKAILAKHLKLNTSTPPKWEPYHPLEDYDYQNGWLCSVCGKHSVVKRKVCDGCDSNMTNI